MSFGRRSCWQTREQKGMSSANAFGNLSSEMEVDAFRRLFTLRFYERHLLESICPDARKLGKARDTTLALGVVASTNGSALAKIDCTTMLAAIKMEVMTPTTESPDEGYIVSGMINFKELSLVSGKAAWMAYLDIYCLDANGALFDAALLAAVAAFSHLQIPVVSLNDDGRVVVVSEEDVGKLKNEPVNKGKWKLKLSSIPFSLTCILHKNYILADSTAEEESIMETLVTVVLDSFFQPVSLYKHGGSVLAYTSAIQNFEKLAPQRQQRHMDGQMQQNNAAATIAPYNYPGGGSRKRCWRCSLGTLAPVRRVCSIWPHLWHLPKLIIASYLTFSWSDGGDAVMARWLQSAGLQHLASPLASIGVEHRLLSNLLMQFVKAPSIEGMEGEGRLIE
ncbi:unnamed protein product [Camellia sinensis]